MTLTGDAAIARTAEIIESYAKSAGLVGFNKETTVPMMHIFGLAARDAMVLTLFEDWAEKDPDWQTRKILVDRANAIRWKD